MLTELHAKKIKLIGGFSMLKKSSEMVTDLMKNMRGGKGEVEMTHIYKQDELTGKARNR